MVAETKGHSEEIDGALLSEVQALLSSVDRVGKKADDLSLEERLCLLGSGLRGLRKLVGLTLHELGILMGLSGSGVCRIEKGESMMPVTRLQTLELLYRLPFPLFFILWEPANGSFAQDMLVFRRVAAEILVREIPLLREELPAKVREAEAKAGAS